MNSRENQFIQKLEDYYLLQLNRLERLWRRLRNSKAAQGFINFPPINFVRRSLPVRLALMMVIVSLLMMGLLSIFVTSTVRDGLFEKRLDQLLLDAAVRNEEIQAKFDGVSVDSSGALQEVAYGVISDQRDSLAGVGGVGIMLLSKPNGKNQINDLVDTGIRKLLTEDLRRAVVSKPGPHWQSVALAAKDGTITPGVIVGSQIRVPLINRAEVYFVYSLSGEQSTLYLIQQTLVTGTVLLMVVLSVMMLVVSYSTLLPVRRAALAASKIAHRDLSARVEVKGIDELARLARAFNDMAASLGEQFNSYQELSKLQQRFVSDVSHELRTPLSSIRIASDLIYEEKDELPAHLDRSAEILHDQVNRFDSMLADLIEISRIDADNVRIQLGDEDLVDLVRGVIESSTPLAQRLGVELRLKADGPCMAAIDHTRIERVVRNLVVNAIEYAEGKPVLVKVAQTGTCAAVQVIDHGQGMTDEVAQHVFDRFYRADTSRKRTTGGTGLGLAISAEDTALHDGLLTVLSCPNFGSAFLLLLPRVEGGEIVDIPSEINYPEMVFARQQWALEHPEDITFDLEDVEFTDLEVKAVDMALDDNTSAEDEDA